MGEGDVGNGVAGDGGRGGGGGGGGEERDREEAATLTENWIETGRRLLH